jgi:hypothetical protein
MKFTPATHPAATQWFNEEYARGVTEDGFVAAMAGLPFWEDVPEREGELRKAWRVMNGQPADRKAADRKAADRKPAA